MVFSIVNKLIDQVDNLVN